MWLCSVHARLSISAECVFRLWMEWNTLTRPVVSLSWALLVCRLVCHFVRSVTDPPCIAASESTAGVSFLWTVLQGNVSLSDRAILRTDPTNPVLVFAPGALSYGSVYEFQLSATDEGGTGTQLIVIMIAREHAFIYLF